MQWCIDRTIYWEEQPPWLFLTRASEWFHCRFNFMKWHYEQMLEDDRRIFKARLHHAKMIGLSRSVIDEYSRQWDKHLRYFEDFKERDLQAHRRKHEKWLYDLGAPASVSVDEYRAVGAGSSYDVGVSYVVTSNAGVGSSLDVGAGEMDVCNAPAAEGCAEACAEFVVTCDCGATLCLGESVCVSDDVPCMQMEADALQGCGGECDSEGCQHCVVCDCGAELCVDIGDLCMRDVYDSDDPGHKKESVLEGSDYCDSVCSADEANVLRVEDAANDVYDSDDPVQDSGCVSMCSDESVYECSSVSSDGYIDELSAYDVHD